MSQPDQPPHEATAASAVATNLRRLRRERELSLRGLAAVLAEAGQPINTDGLNRIELGTRKTTVDELVAIASVLDVTPAAMLNDPDPRPAAPSPAPSPQPVLYCLRPGDRVLVTVNHDPEDGHDWVPRLEALFPGVRFVVLGGVTGLAVQSGDAP